jgi:DNA-binding phage protein
MTKIAMKTAGRKVKLLKHDTTASLGDVDRVFKAFMACLGEGDVDSACEILAASLRHLNKSELERRYHIPRRTTYNLLDKKSMPSLELVAKACLAIKQEAARR